MNRASVLMHVEFGVDVPSSQRWIRVVEHSTSRDRIDSQMSCRVIFGLTLVRCRNSGLLSFNLVGSAISCIITQVTDMKQADFFQPDQIAGVTSAAIRRDLFNSWYDGTGEREGKPYPRKVDRGAALKVFQRKITTPRLWRALGLKTDAYLKDVEHTEKTAIKHPSTFLNAFEIEDLIDTIADQNRGDKRRQRATAKAKVTCQRCGDSGVLMRWTLITYSKEWTVGATARRIDSLVQYRKTIHTEIDTERQRLTEMPFACPCGAKRVRAVVTVGEVSGYKSPQEEKAASQSIK